MDSGKKDRPKQRELIRWDNDKDIDVLLAIVKQCNIHKINIPWDLVGQEVGPKVTGNAVIQHLAKLRKKVEQVKRSGVKPTPQKSGYSVAIAQPRRPAKGKAAAKGGNANNDDDEELVDVDKASDPDESYGETVKKRKGNPRRAKGTRKTYRDVASDDEAAPTTPKDQVMADPVSSSPVKAGAGSAAVKKRKAGDSSSVEIDTPSKPRGGRKSLKQEFMSEDEEPGHVKKEKGKQQVKGEEKHEPGLGGANMETPTFAGSPMVVSDAPSTALFDAYASAPVQKPAGDMSSPPSQEMSQGFHGQGGQFGSSFTSVNPFNAVPTQGMTNPYSYQSMMAPAQQSHGFLDMGGQNPQLGSGFGYGMTGQQMPMNPGFGQQMGNHGMQMGSAYGQDMGGQPMQGFEQLLQQRPANFGWLNAPGSSAGVQGTSMPQNLMSIGNDNEDGEEEEVPPRDRVFNMLRGGNANDGLE